MRHALHQAPAIRMTSVSANAAPAESVRRGPRASAGGLVSASATASTRRMSIRAVGVVADTAELPALGESALDGLNCSFAIAYRARTDRRHAPADCKARCERPATTADGHAPGQHHGADRRLPEFGRDRGTSTHGQRNPRARTHPQSMMTADRQPAATMPACGSRVAGAIDGDTPMSITVTAPSAFANLGGRTRTRPSPATTGPASAAPVDNRTGGLAIAPTANGPRRVRPSGPQHRQ